MASLDELFDKHSQTIHDAITAVHTREFYAHWPEPPSGKIYGETAQADGEAAFKESLNKNFERLMQDGAEAWHGEDESPYGLALNIKYPFFSPQTLVERAKAAYDPWRRLAPKQRAGMLIEALEAAAKRFFEIAFATMHTTGQGFVMSFQASGPHAFDRALEAVALGYEEQTRFSESVLWEKPMGKTSVRLQKSVRPVGRGVSLAIGCSTFPVWNSFPSIFASLATGNPVIVKPHPKAVLPLAIAIAEVQKVFADSGVDPNTIQLGVDGDALIAKDLAQHPDVKIIDYTGSTAFGDWLEALPGKVVFTEKAGVNSVILESAEQLDGALENLAFSISLYSGQMCTTPQNIFIPEQGVREGDTVIPYADVIRRFAAKVTELVKNPKMGAGTLGAIQNPATVQRMERAATLGFPTLLWNEPIDQPGFAGARSASPAVYEIREDKRETLHKEMFGPVTFVVPVKDVDEAIRLASDISANSGAITCAAYTTDDAVAERIEDALGLAGVSVALNLTGPVWVNQSATFSDFHVSGGNPSGNASLVDPAFIVRRFFFASVRKPAKEGS